MPPGLHSGGGSNVVAFRLSPALSPEDCPPLGSNPYTSKFCRLSFSYRYSFIFYCVAKPPFCVIFALVNHLLDFLCVRIASRSPQPPMIHLPIRSLHDHQRKSSSLSCSKIAMSRSLVLIIIILFIILNFVNSRFFSTFGRSFITEYAAKLQNFCNTTKFISEKNGDISEITIQGGD